MSVMNQVGLVALKSSMSMEEVMEMIPFLLPVMIIELLLAVVALVHVLRHNHFRCGNKVIWALVVLFVGIIGPVAYFIFGKGEEE